MTDIVERLRRGADDASLDCYAMCEEAAARIEALKVQVAWWEEQWRQQATRIVALEAALQKIAKRQYREPWEVIEIACAALAPEQDK